MPTRSFWDNVISGLSASSSRRPRPRGFLGPERLSETPDLGVALRRATPRARRPTLTVPRSVWHFSAPQPCGSRSAT